jgi:hypothetical protein
MSDEPGMELSPAKNLFTVRYREWIDKYRGQHPDFSWGQLSRDTGILRDSFSRMYRFGVKRPSNIPVKSRKILFALTNDPLLNPKTWQEYATLDIASPEAQELIKQYGNVVYDGASPVQKVSSAQKEEKQESRLEQRVASPDLSPLRNAVADLLQGIDAVMSGIDNRAPGEYANLAREDPSALGMQIASKAYSLAYALLASKDLPPETRTKLQEQLPKKDVNELIYLLHSIHKNPEEIIQEAKVFNTDINLTGGPYKVKS